MGGVGAEKRGAGRFRTGFVDDRDAFGSAEKKMKIINFIGG